LKKVLLLGHGPSALTALQSLVKQFSVVAVVRQREKGSFEDPVERCAHEHNIPIISDPTVSSVERAVIELQPDCVVASSYNRILGERILTRSRFVNVHYSHLPRYRGLAAVNWVVANREHETAITIHSMTPDLDAGNILYQQVVPVGPDQTAGELLTVLNDIQLEVLGDTVSRHLEGYTGSPQDEFGRTFACARVPEDGEIDWAASTEKIYALIRALSPPWPGAHTYLGTRRVTIVRASPVTHTQRYEGRIPGRVIGRSRADGFADVLTGDGILRIHEVTTEEGGVVPASAEITSTRQTLGLRAADLLIRIKELERRLNEGQSGNTAVSGLLGQRPYGGYHCSALNTLELERIAWALKRSLSRPSGIMILNMPARGTI
jgi:methionyl-tRNA formyltransferase